MSKKAPDAKSSKNGSEQGSALTRKDSFTLVKAQALVPGAGVGLFAPASPATAEELARGIRELEQRGFSVHCPQDAARVDYGCEHGFACGSQETRAQAFHQLLENEQVSAIIAVRGGYGSLDLLPLLDFAKIRDAKKLIVGYSDVTVLLSSITQRTGLATIHGPAAAVEFACSSTDLLAKQSVDNLVLMMTAPSFRPELSTQVVREGVSKQASVGRLLVGNLTMFLSLLATPWEPEFAGSILVLEDRAEAPYRIQRALTQLKLAGKLDNLAGLVFGRFSQAAQTISSEAPSAQDVLMRFTRDSLAGTDYPVLYDAAIGHNGLNLPLALGCQAQIAENRLEILEAPIVA